jgi:hypothetical protein
MGASVIAPRAKQYCPSSSTVARHSILYARARCSGVGCSLGKRTTAQKRPGVEWRPMGDAKLRDWEGRTCGVRELGGIDNCNRSSDVASVRAARIRSSSCSVHETSYRSRIWGRGSTPSPFLHLCSSNRTQHVIVQNHLDPKHTDSDMPAATGFKLGL